MNKEKILFQIQNDPFICQRYQLNRLIVINERVSVYQAVNKSNDLTITLKVETISHFHRQKSLVQKQYCLFKLLKGNPGIPPVFKKGKWDNGYFLEMCCLKRDISFLTQYSIRRNVDWCCQVFCSILRIIAAFHEIGYCLGKVSPQNFYLGFDKKIYIMRCPYAKSLQEKFLNIQAGNQKFSLWQINYASLRSLKRRKCTYSDDIESAFYMLCHFYQKDLPWSEKTTIQQIIQQKQNYTPRILQKIGKNYLNCFRYIKSLQQNVKPDYQYIMRNLQNQKYQINSMQKNLGSVQQNQNQQSRNFNSTSYICEVENEKEVINFSKQFNTSISSIVINRVSKKTISTFSSTIQISSKALLDFFQDYVASQGIENQNQDAEVDFDIQPPRMPDIPVIRVHSNPKF